MSATDTCSVATFLVIWCVVGGLVWREIATISKPAGWHVFMALVCGPLIALREAWRGLGRLRRKVLRIFGVEGYSCCGPRGGPGAGAPACRHDREPPAGGASNAGGSRRGKGYHADQISNHPFGHL